MSVPCSRRIRSPDAAGRGSITPVVPRASAPWGMARTVAPGVGNAMRSASSVTTVTPGISRKRGRMAAVSVERGVSRSPATITTGVSGSLLRSDAKRRNASAMAALEGRTE